MHRYIDKLHRGTRALLCLQNTLAGIFLTAVPMFHAITLYIFIRLPMRSPGEKFALETTSTFFERSGDIKYSPGNPARNAIPYLDSLPAFRCYIFAEPLGCDLVCLLCHLLKEPEPRGPDLAHFSSQPFVSGTMNVFLAPG